ncbi:MAG TPA: RDD family protein [Dehalococcoidales bacterium]|nr:RDD family protein [Dehalococcoidales bacterium]
MENAGPEDTGRESGQTGTDPVALPSGKKTCPGCGTVNEASSAYCYRCGLKLPTEVRSGAEVMGNPAGFWIRFLAFILDQVLLSVVGITISLLVTDLTLADMLARAIDPEAPFLWNELFTTFALEAGYWTITIGTWGRTAGKALLRIKVTRVDGSSVSYPRSFVRYLAYYISWFTLGLGFLAIPLNPRKKGLHDLVCDTRVIRT